MFDLTPKQIIDVARRRIPASYVRKVESYKYGAGVFKLDYALSQPVPWRAVSCQEAATVHIGGTLDEISRSEAAVSRGHVTKQPFIIFVQTSLFDPTRVPEGKQIGWAYCHVPNGSTENMTDHIEGQIERFAPGFRDCILARNAMSPADMEAYNANYIGGDINGGAAYLSQLFTRPVARLDPYKIPETDMFICSSSTPPGGGVHGMCGFHAARSALSHLDIS
jgi:phytoene dehydrogenase-like protein